LQFEALESRNIRQDGLVINWADGTGFLVLHGSRLWHDWLLVFDGDLETKL
jgi:hypothetical protein